jgi:hypothetical protein
MAAYEQQGALFSLPDGSWSVYPHDRRLVFRNGQSALELHGWMALAALIALRHCLLGVVVGVALPAGYHEWDLLAARLGPVRAWMHTLADLDEAELPPVPPQIDDGLGDQPPLTHAFGGPA